MSLEERNNKYENSDGSILVAPQTSWLKTLRILWFEEINWVYNNFIWKKVTDLWSGLGWFILEIESSCDQINAVDPLYVNKNKFELLIRDKERLKNMISHSVWFLNTKKAKCEELAGQLNRLFMLAPNPRNIDEISNLETQKDEKHRSIKIIDEWLLWKKEVLEDVKKWEERWFNDSEKIKIIWRAGENTGINSNTQDYVLIKHLINKDSVNSNKLLNEALRITKNGWNIFIIDDKLDLDRLKPILDWLNYSYDTKEKLQIIEITK